MSENGVCPLDSIGHPNFCEPWCVQQQKEQLEKWKSTIWLWLTVCHGKIHPYPPIFKNGKPLFRLGPSKNHGYVMLVITRGYIAKNWRVHCKTLVQHRWNSARKEVETPSQVILQNWLMNTRSVTGIWSSRQNFMSQAHPFSWSPYHLLKSSHQWTYQSQHHGRWARSVLLWFKRRCAAMISSMISSRIWEFQLRPRDIFRWLFSAYRKPNA